MAVSAHKREVGLVRNAPLSICNDEFWTDSRSLSWEGEQESK